MRVCRGDNLSEERTKPPAVADIAIAHGLVTRIAAVVADSATCSGAFTIHTDLANDVIFTFGSIECDTVTVSFACTDRSRTARPHGGKGRRYHPIAAGDDGLKEQNHLGLG